MVDDATCRLRINMQAHSVQPQVPEFQQLYSPECPLLVPPTDLWLLGRDAVAAHS